ncbi:MAG: hypothetical protein FWD13_01255 [Treponema sp.]|nr:hypothetical protein [Treponema sp.]
MKNTLKKVMVILFMAAFVFVIIGCSGKKDADAVDNSPRGLAQQTFSLMQRLENSFDENEIDRLFEQLEEIEDRVDALSYSDQEIYYDELERLMKADIASTSGLDDVWGALDSATRLLDSASNLTGTLNDAQNLLNATSGLLDTASNLTGSVNDAQNALNSANRLLESTSNITGSVNDAQNALNQANSALNQANNALNTLGSFGF